MEDYWQQREAKRVAQAQEEGSKGAPRELPEPEASGNDRVLPTNTAPNREQVLGITQEFLEHVHTLRLQTMHEMGSVREVGRTLVPTLMAEFLRLQLIVGEEA